VHTARKRLLGIAEVKPFWVQNLGRYERQQWLRAEFGEADSDRKLAAELQYRQFILELYRAEPFAGGLLHGLRAGAFVHIGSVDAPVTADDCKALLKEYRRSLLDGQAGSTNAKIDVLGWEFAFDVNETAKQLGAESGIAFRFFKIPHEVLEKKAVQQGDIKFFELAYAKIDTKIGSEIDKKANKNTVNLTLADFIMPVSDVPDEVRKAIKHWSQWIDYWAVDWNHEQVVVSQKEDAYFNTFHNTWQSYRTRQKPDLAFTTSHTYTQAGVYQVVVKIIDILGNDTTKVVEVEIN
jgi:adenine-specific DNA-methyltransferase